jgi:hypothetical protein
MFTGDTSGLGGVVDDGLLIFRQAANSSFAGAISGSGGLTQQGSGTRSGITSRSKCASFSISQISCSSTGPRGPAVWTFRLSVTGAPVA